MKRIIKLILVVLMSFGMFLPNVAQTVRALDSLTVTISDGFATWEPFAGADRYHYVYLNSAGYINSDEELKLDLTKNAIQYGYDTGDYELELYAEKHISGDTYERISDVYKNLYHYESKGKLKQPTGLHWKEMLPNGMPLKTLKAIAFIFMKKAKVIGLNGGIQALTKERWISQEARLFTADQNTTSL